jgi:hypothetical protein
MAPEGVVADQQQRRDALGPEGLAGILSIAVVAIIAIGLLIPPSSGPTQPGGATSTATPSVGPSSEPLDVTQARFALTVVERLLDDRSDLVGLSRASPFDSVAAATAIRRVDADCRVAVDMATQLAGSPEAAAFARRLETIGNTGLAEATTVLQLSPAADATAYARSTSRLVAALDPLTALAADLRAFIANASRATPTPRASASAPSSVPPSTEPSPSLEPTTPASPLPSGSVAPTTPPGPELLIDGSFENATPAPWELVDVPPAAATLTLDTADPAAGKRSARVNISVGSDQRASIAILQGNIALATGHTYHASVELRASADREVRVRVVSADGTTTYATRVATVSTAWAVLEFDFTSFVADPTAAFEIDLGRSTATTWIDEASLVNVTGG